MLLREIDHGRCDAAAMLAGAGERLQTVAVCHMTNQGAAHLPVCAQRL